MNGIRLCKEKKSTRTMESFPFWLDVKSTSFVPYLVPEFFGRGTLE